MAMRHVISIALFVGLALLPLQAQRGGRGGGGSHAGGGYRGSGAVASRGASGGYRAGPQYPVRSQAPSNRWGGYGGFYYGHGGDRFHHRYVYPSYYSPYYGSVYPYAYSAYPIYDLGFSSDYSGNNDSNAYTQQLSNQVSSLSAEMQQLRDENDNLRDYIVERNAPPPPSPDRRIPPSVSAPLQPEQSVAQPSESENPSVPTVLVFKDGHTLDAPNYAIVDSTVWVLTGRRATKVPISQIDLEKTKELNEQHGVEFAAPPAQ